MGDGLTRLRQALQTHGYGFNDDWKCIGGVVNDCTKKRYNWYERGVASSFHGVWWNPGIATDIPKIRDEMRTEVIATHPKLLPIVELPPQPKPR